MKKHSVMLCNCNNTMHLDGAAVGRALRAEGPIPVRTELCRRQVGQFEAALKGGGDCLVACTQEAALFDQVAGTLESGGELRFVNIRETAGWSRDGKGATPKVAALLAAAMLPDPEPAAKVSYRSGGQLLVIGPAGVATQWAERLSSQLAVNVLVTGTGGGDELPVERAYPVHSGRVRRISGHLGSFVVEWEQENPIDLEACTRCGACIRACPEGAIDFSYQIDLERCRSHRACVKACGDIGAIDFERAARDRTEGMDLILDLSDPPSFRMPQPPQGYLAPGRDPLDQSLAAAELAQMVGEFEKPRYFAYKESICAHGRNKVTGCSQCIEVCSTSAIRDAGDRVEIDPHLCMGCGGCATVCPSGAMSHVYPRVPDLGRRVKTMLQIFREAGGADPVLLVHNAKEGRELVNRLGRRGPGLPSNVIPLEVHHVAAVGLDLQLGAIAWGAAGVRVLATGCEAADYLAALRSQMRFGEEILQGFGYAGDHLGLVETDDPAALGRELRDAAPARTCPPATFNLFPEKRSSLEFAFDHLARHAPVPAKEVALSAGAPWGTLEVNRDTCTLCLSCVGACPEKALLDSKELPQLRFVEANCVQCGLCRTTCPENAITLKPRLLVGREAKEARVLNEAAVHHCPRCGKAFATKQMIDTLVGRMAGHSMFAEPGALERLKMCADCRVADMMKQDKGVSIFDV